MKRSIIYVAGSYRSKYGYMGVMWNIFKARKVAIKLAKQGYCCFIPHQNWAFMKANKDDEFWLECGLKILRHCSAIYMMKGWRKSVGSVDEIWHAQQRGLKVMYEDESDKQIEDNRKELETPQLVKFFLGTEAPYKVEGKENENLP